jgi:hypothetical protein
MRWSAWFDACAYGSTHDEGPLADVAHRAAQSVVTLASCRAVSVLNISEIIVM